MVLLLIKCKVLKLSSIYVPLPDGHSANVLDSNDDHNENDDNERANLTPISTTGIKPMLLLNWFCFSFLYEAFQVQSYKLYGRK